MRVPRAPIFVVICSLTFANSALAGVIFEIAGKSFDEPIKLSRIVGKRDGAPTRDVGESVVQRLNRHWRKKEESPDCRLGKDVYPLLAFNAEHLDSIVKKGFLNFHQTHNGNGCTSCESQRYTTEARLINADDDDVRNISPTVLPKYAYAVSNTNKNILAARVAAFYGEVFARFKSDVLKRTTITEEDSLNLGAVGRPLTSCLDKPWTGGAHNYYEAQIWGELTVQDVDILIVDCPDLGLGSESVIRVLKEHHLNIPVYNCVLDREGDRRVPMPKKLLYGTPRR